MELLKDNEMLEYKGGAKISIGIVSAVIAVGAFILGIIDGIANPKRCNK